MELTGEKHLPVARERVWAALLDTRTLRAAIPGCENVEDEGDGRFTVSVVAAVGPVKARFKGRLQQEDLQPPARYTLSFEGDGGMAGFAKGSAEVELAEASASATVLTYRAQAQIGGRLAQIGSRLVDATAARMSQQFFDRLISAIAQPQAVPAPAREFPLAAGVPPSAPMPSGGESPAPVVGTSAAGGWGGNFTVSMPGWAWAFTVGAVSILTAWLTTHGGR